MKALILAGGRGTRLRPLTHTTNKHLLPIGNKPMIFRVIEDVLDLGIKEIIINKNKGDKELPIIVNLANKSWKANIQYIEQPEPNGMMYPIKLAEELIGDEDFFFSAGDNILSGGLKKHRDDFITNKSDAHVLVVRRPDYQQFGVAVLNSDGTVKYFIEKPKTFVSDFVITAIYFFKPIVIKAFDEIKPIDPNGSGRLEYYPPPVNNWLLDNGYKFSISEVTGWWKDTGKASDLIDANALVLDKDIEEVNLAKIDSGSKVTGRVHLEKSVKIINSIIRGPVSILKGTVVKDSYIGPFTSIGRDCEICNSEIENSILLQGSKITNHRKRIDNSILGYNSDVQGILGNTNVYCIGDNSTLQI